jgi:hypothetical protein
MARREGGRRRLSAGGGGHGNGHGEGVGRQVLIMLLLVAGGRQRGRRFESESRTLHGVLIHRRERGVLQKKVAVSESPGRVASRSSDVQLARAAIERAIVEYSPRIRNGSP